MPTTQTRAIAHLVFIGLGNVGGELAANLARNGFDVAGHDIDEERPWHSSMSALDVPRALRRWRQVLISSSPACPRLRSAQP